jgi:hypothetical protein
MTPCIRTQNPFYTTLLSACLHPPDFTEASHALPLPLNSRVLSAGATRREDAICYDAGDRQQQQQQQQHR